MGVEPHHALGIGKPDRMQRLGDQALLLAAAGWLLLQALARQEQHCHHRQQSPNWTLCAAAEVAEKAASASADVVSFMTDMMSPITCVTYLITPMATLIDVLMRGGNAFVTNA